MMHIITAKENLLMLRRDRKFWLEREQRWLDLAKSQELSERLDDFVQSPSALASPPAAPPPEPEEALRLLIALNGINSPEQMAEVLQLAERLARDAPGFKELMDLRQTRH